MSLGKGAAIDISAKQKVNADSSTTAELYGVHQCLPKMRLNTLFLEAQGFDTECRLHQDNLSTVKLEVNGKRSLGQRTRHLHIKYFTITDHIENGWINVQYCPTAEMTADFYTKPLTGALFLKFRARIMNCPEDLPPAAKQSAASAKHANKNKKSPTKSKTCPQECVATQAAAPGRRRASALRSGRKLPRRPGRPR